MTSPPGPSPTQLRRVRAWPLPMPWAAPMPKTPRPQLSLPRAAAVFHMLGDESRLHILLLLTGHEELNVTALGKALGQSQPAVSHHLSLLRMAGLVRFRREGR